MRKIAHHMKKYEFQYGYLIRHGDEGGPDAGEEALGGAVLVAVLPPPGQLTDPVLRPLEVCATQSQIVKEFC